MTPIATYRDESGRLNLLCVDGVQDRKPMLRHRCGPRSKSLGYFHGYYSPDRTPDKCIAAYLLPTLRLFVRCDASCKRSDDGRRSFGHWRRLAPGVIP